MKRILFVAILLFSTLNLFSQTTETKNEVIIDALDISMQKEQIEKYGVPTLSVVEEMKKKADALYDAQSWEQAAVAYEIYAQNVNWLANLLSQCVEPYYSASYDKKSLRHIRLLNHLSLLNQKQTNVKKIEIGHM